MLSLNLPRRKTGGDSTMMKMTFKQLLEQCGNSSVATGQSMYSSAIITITQFDYTHTTKLHCKQFNNKRTWASVRGA